jgi:hypothetical protein
MTYRAKAAVCSEIHTKHSKQSEHHVEFWWYVKKPIGVDCNNLWYFICAKRKGISCVRIVICVTLSSNINPQIVMILHFVAPFTGLHLSFALGVVKSLLNIFFPPLAQQPPPSPVGHGLLIHAVSRSRSTTHHIR